MLPHFVIVGASRAGTTTLFTLLQQNPQIFMPRKKELHFFYKDKLYIDGLAWYERQFKRSKKDQLIGEASPPYFHSGIIRDVQGKHKFDLNNDSATRMHQLMPNARIIITLRNPVTRSYSQYWKNVWEGHEKSETYKQAIEDELKGNRPPDQSAMCWLYKNNYALHVQKWIDLFSKENVHIMIFEEWIKDIPNSMRKLEEFIGVDYLPRDNNSVGIVNAGRTERISGVSLIGKSLSKLPIIKNIYKGVATQSGYPKMDDQLHLKVTEYFSDSISELEKITGKSLQIWRYSK